MTEIEYSVQSRNVRLKKIHIPLPKWMAPPALKMIPSCLVEEEPASIAPFVRIISVQTAMNAQMRMKRRWMQLPITDDNGRQLRSKSKSRYPFRGKEG